MMRPAWGHVEFTPSINEPLNGINDRCCDRQQQRAPGGLAAERPADRQENEELSINICGRAPALSSICGQRHFHGRRWRLNTDSSRKIYYVPV